jgi:cellulose biosynthesis protein BcsQ
MDPLHTALFEKVRAGSNRAVCFFNNKGGVGKTTLVANLAAELSQSFGAKVLVVDADPQCNLTQYVLDEETSLELYQSDEAEINSIFSVIRPLSLGHGYLSELPIRRAENFEFDLIIGDPRLALREDLLAQDWRDAKSGGMRGIQTTFVFADLVEKAKSLGYDYIFFDMGPSLGAINRSILLTMDHFIVPVAIDIFSLWAIKNIGTTVRVWQKELRTGISLAEEPSALSKALRFDRLRFLGYVTQQHKERGTADPDDDARTLSKNKKIVQAYEEIAASFPKVIQDELGSLFETPDLNPHLGDIKHLSSLAPKSQSQHQPMISMAAKGSYTQLRAQARQIYRDIAVRFLENLSGAR